MMHKWGSAYVTGHQALCMLDWLSYHMGPEGTRWRSHHSMWDYPSMTWKLKTALTSNVQISILFQDEQDLTWFSLLYS